MAYSAVCCAFACCHPTLTNAFTNSLNPARHISCNIKSSLSIFASNRGYRNGVDILPGAPLPPLYDASSPHRGSDHSTYGTSSAPLLDCPAADAAPLADVALWDRAAIGFFCFFYFFVGFSSAYGGNSMRKDGVGPLLHSDQ